MSARADRRRLAEQYPLAFVPRGAGRRKHCLKIGIIEDVMARGLFDSFGERISDERVRAAVNAYKSGAKYCHAIARGGRRYDLDGKPHGWISSRLQESAQKKIVEMGWQKHDGTEAAA